MSNRLLHTKVSKRKPLQHFPKKEDGHNGDIQIASIKGKGTYLCIKDKGEWKISEKFNPRNKFDTHIFDEIETRKIRGISGVVMSLGGKTTTLSDGVSYTQTMAEFGSGATAGIISSKGDQDLILKTGSSATSNLKIIDGTSGNITSLLNTDGIFDVRCFRTSSNPIAQFRNQTTSGTADSFIQVRTASTDGDVYANFAYAPGEGAWKQWSFGMDANDSDSFKILGEFNDSAKIGIDDTSVDASFKIDTSGNTTTSGTATAGGFTTTGTWTMDTSAGGTTGITNINITNAFTDDDVTIMSAGAIKEKIESYGYTTATGDITGVTLTGDSGGALADTAGSADFTIAGGTNCTSAGSGSTITVNVDDAFITNDADDTMAGTLTIDKNTTRTTTGTEQGLIIDYDHTGISASGQTVTGIGLDIDMNCESITHVGTVNQTGVDIAMVAATAGTQTNTGINISCTGADTNTHLQLSHDSTNYCTLATIANGATTITTVDSDGAAGHLTLDPNGDLIISGADTKIDATQKLYLDGGGDTYIKEGIADRLDIYVGGANIVRIIEGVADYIYINGDIAVEAGEKLIFDSAIGGHTHIRESADDELDITVGDDIMLHLDENGADGNQAHFVNASVGFTQLEPTYDVSSTTVDFRHSNKQNLTFGSGNTGHMNLYFPEMSGNFILLIKQDGTGSRTVTGAWRVYEFDESTADGATEVVWAGGSAPTLTTDANHVDILSFYWDADNEIAYGVATLDFQF